MDRYEILTMYGNQILQNKLFEAASMQKHHFRTDVASHSINTAFFCIAFYRFLSIFNIRVNLSALIIAALAHDLGILGRKEKFSSGFECITRHPKDSVVTIMEIIPGVDPRICDVISSHMFPLCAEFPHSREAWLLSLADKCAACTDIFKHYRVSQLLITPAL